MIKRTDDVAGTHLVGEVKTTRADLTALFGKPIEYGEDGDKVTIEWGIKWGDVTATIYDWKRYEEGTPAMGELYNYHVGGRDHKALELVNGLLDLGKKVL